MLKNTSFGRKRSSNKKRVKFFHDDKLEVDRIGNIHKMVGKMEQNSVLALEGGKTSRNERGFASFIRGENVERLCRRRVGHSNKLEARLLARDGLLRWKKSA